MENIDYTTELVLGENINFQDICTIHQHTLSEIRAFGYGNYGQLLLPYTISKESLNIENDNVTNFDLLFINLTNEEGNEIDMFDLFIQSLKLFCKEETILINKEDSSFVFKKGVIDKNNFDEFANIMLKINGLEKSKKTVPPKNKEKLSIWEKLQKGRAKKNINADNDANLANILNIVKFGMESYISKEELRKMTMWEIYNAYKNIINKESYRNNFEISLVSTTENKDLDLKHWTVKTIN